MSAEGWEEAFGIHHVEGKYLVFETAILRRLREKHDMCGVLVGTLPQIAQQNVFLGLPLELMIEEAAYLVRHGHAYIVDDRRVHRETMSRMTTEDIQAFKDHKTQQAMQSGQAARLTAAKRRKEALERRGLSHLLEETAVGRNDSLPVHVDTVSSSFVYRPFMSDHQSLILGHSSRSINPTSLVSDEPSVSNNQSSQPSSLVCRQSTSLAPQPDAARYDLYAHLHEKKYFLTPGLRFGAQFVAYPGDPLRFHSHFVASGHGYDDSIPVMDIVGGGRLGTGVKKAWLVGGRDEEGQMACFTVEWAGM